MTLIKVRSKNFMAKRQCQARIKFFADADSTCSKVCKDCSRREFVMIDELVKFFHYHIPMRQGSKYSFKVNNSFKDYGVDVKICNVDVNEAAQYFLQDFFRRFVRGLPCKRLEETDELLSEEDDIDYEMSDSIHGGTDEEISSREEDSMDAEFKETDESMDVEVKETDESSSEEDTDDEMSDSSYGGTHEETSSGEEASMDVEFEELNESSSEEDDRDGEMSASSYGVTYENEISSGAEADMDDGDDYFDEDIYISVPRLF